MRPGAELLIDTPAPARAGRFMAAMAAARPPETEVTKHYRSGRRLLVLYGPGAARKLPLIERHKKAGGHVAMFDLGYWDRLDSMRLSIDSMHPRAEQLAMAPNGPGRKQFYLREDADPDGPILLVGLGNKSCFAYGLQCMEWEHKQLQQLRRRLPDRKILWRPKGRIPTPLAGTTLCHGQPIEQALQDCSLVVCRHSNVAVDACVAGVPVECEDGAALALYRDNPNPTREQRAEFLRRLTWWEWHKNDCAKAWSWIEKVSRAAL